MKRKNRGLGEKRRLGRRVVTHTSWNKARSLSTRGLLAEPRNFWG